jgi:hypothetical protein
MSGENIMRKLFLGGIRDQRSEIGKKGSGSRYSAFFIIPELFDKPRQGQKI